MPATKQTYGSTNPLLNTQPISGNTPGAFQFTTGGQATMMGPVAPTVTPTAKPAPTTARAPVAAIPTSVVNEPTVGETLQGIKTQALTIQDQINQMKTAEAAAKGKKYSPVSLNSNNNQNPYDKPIDERAITQNQMRLFQAEIDSTNKVYDQLYNQKVMEGTGRLGSQRAQAARGGLLGSDFGSAQQDTVTGYNSQITNAVQAERSAKIGSIMGTMRTAVSDEIAKKRLARTQDADAYLKYLNGRDETKQKNTQTIAASFLSQGIDPSTLTPDEMKAITGDTSISAADIIMDYQSAKSAQDTASADSALKTKKTNSDIDVNTAQIGKMNSDVANAGYFNLSEGQSRYDASGKVIASKGKTYAPGTGGRGEGFISGGFTASSEEVGEVTRTLDDSRGETDNFANTGVYLEFLQQSVNGGALPQDFLKKFPPDLYLNPDDSSVPAYIKQDMAKVDAFNNY